MAFLDVFISPVLSLIYKVIIKGKAESRTVIRRFEDRNIVEFDREHTIITKKSRLNIGLFALSLFLTTLGLVLWEISAFSSIVIFVVGVVLALPLAAQVAGLGRK